MSRMVKRSEELLEKANELTGSKGAQVETAASASAAALAAIVAAGVDPAVGAASDSAQRHVGHSSDDECSSLTGSVQDPAAPLPAVAAAAAPAGVAAGSAEKPKAQMARQAERALEMWQKLAKTASTPSTFVNPSSDGSAAVHDVSGAGSTKRKTEADSTAEVHAKRVATE